MGKFIGYVINDIMLIVNEVEKYISAIVASMLAFTKFEDFTMCWDPPIPYSLRYQFQME